MAITASMVAELRAKTDAPMMECKKALTEADGNFEKAEELALSALRIQHSECYEKGLEKIRQQRSQFESVTRQLGDLKRTTADLTAR